MIFDFIGVLEIANVPDEEMRRIIKTLRKNSFYYDNPKYYENRLNSYFNELIIKLVKEVEKAVQEFKEYKVDNIVRMFSIILFPIMFNHYSKKRSK